ncbi:Tetratricopeptide repeat protein 25 [Irineochytrium annulatum]|nr:Tetratricopeptide repeat protein 25 [Irineochytrium annulatum]
MSESPESPTNRKAAGSPTRPVPDEVEIALVSFAAAGDNLCKQGEYKKAIEAYTKALLIRPDKPDKNVLVARSRVYLQYGDSEAALADANGALKVDPDFFKAVFQKAEALYNKGDFEMALVYYHRGNKLRPELKKFRLGIQKAREAIDNSIGNPKDYKFQPPPIPKTVPNVRPHSAPAPNGSAAAAAGPNASGRPSPSLPRESVHVNRAESRRARNKSGKQLLGELHEDKVYLEMLLNDKDFINKPNNDVVELVSTALKYLEDRTEFWRQQKPLYARRKDHSKAHAKAIAERHKEALADKAREFNERQQAEMRRVNSPKAGGWAPDVVEQDEADGATGERAVSPRLKERMRKKSSEPEKAVNASMNIINRAIDKGDFVSALNTAKAFLTRLHDMAGLLDRDRAISDVLSTLGNVCVELGSLTQGLNYHRQDFTLARTHDLPDCQLRSLSNIGRTCVRLGRFEDAIVAFERRLRSCPSPSSTPTPGDGSLDRAWLLHDIGRCHLEMGRDQDARVRGEECKGIADVLGDARWGLNARVLIAQAETRTGNYTRAMTEYMSALSQAKALNDSHAVDAISTAIEDLLPMKINEGKRGGSAKGVRPASAAARVEGGRDGDVDGEGMGDAGTRAVIV